MKIPKKKKPYSSPRGVGPDVPALGQDGKPLFRLSAPNSIPKKPLITAFRKDHIGRWVHVGRKASPKSFELVCRINEDGSAYTLQPWCYADGLFGAYNRVEAFQVVAVGPKFDLPTEVMKLRPGSDESAQKERK